MNQGKSGIPTELGTRPIGRLLAQYAVPAIIAMTASSLYNMVDSIFIGQGVGPLAISGLAVTFPLMNLAAAFGSLVGVGASTLLSVKLGQRDYDSARRVLGNVVTLNVVLGAGFTVAVLLALDPVLRFFGASADTLPYARDYMTVILLGNVVTHMYLGLNALLRASGRPRTAMAATVATVAVNTLLDPLFIYGLGWGIRGAAVATVLAQSLSLAWQLRLFTAPGSLLRLQRGIYRLRGDLVGRMLAIGLSPFLMNLASCLIVVFFNRGLKAHGGDLAIGAFGIVNRILFLFCMVVIGLNQGMQPIAGYNFGARQYPRVSRVLKLTVYAATAVTTLGFLVGEGMPRLAVSAFTADETLIGLAAEGLRVSVAAFPLIGFQMVTGNFFQCIGMAGKAIFLSLTRQLLFLLPCVLLLPLAWGVKGVWLSMPASDLASSVVAGVMLYRQFRQFRARAAQAPGPAAPDDEPNDKKGYRRCVT